MNRCHVAILFVWLAFAARVEAVDDAAQVKPLLKQKCDACHGALKQAAGLRLDTVALMLKGGESGSAAKLIIERVTATDEHKRMPQEAAALMAEHIAMLRTWVDAGAPRITNEVPSCQSAAQSSSARLVRKNFRCLLPSLRKLASKR